MLSMFRQDLPKLFALQVGRILNGKCPPFGYHLRSSVRPLDASEPRLLQRKFVQKGKCGVSLKLRDTK
jgi:hypothetical protein